MNLAVALLAEGVDRNCLSSCRRSSSGVALLAEGVDRNQDLKINDITPAQSPSSRRAWIEIQGRRTGVQAYLVALLAEGVDRNRVIL